jgi:hypothetical protein
LFPGGYTREWGEGEKRKEDPRRRAEGIDKAGPKTISSLKKGVAG